MTANLTGSFGHTHNRVFGGRVWEIATGTNERHNRSGVDDRPSGREIAVHDNLRE